MSAHESFVVMGHSEITHNFQNKIKKVPPNLVLVFTTQCGTAFSENTFFRPILMNKAKMNNYLKSNTFKNIHVGGSEYADQLIGMPHVSEPKGIPHGVYNLPMNIKNINRPPVLFNTKSNQRVHLSTILKFLSRRIEPGKTGIVFGLFCRSIEGTNYPSYASTHPRNFVYVGNRTLPRSTSMYEKLRPVSTRKPVQNVLQKARVTKNLFKTRVQSVRRFTPKSRTPFQKVLSIFIKPRNG
jgi:hypothetical protein